MRKYNYNPGFDENDTNDAYKEAYAFGQALGVIEWEVKFCVFFLRKTVELGISQNYADACSLWIFDERTIARAMDYLPMIREAWVEVPRTEEEITALAREVVEKIRFNRKEAKLKIC